MAGMNWRGTGTAHGVVDVDQARAARGRLDLEVHLGELPAAAGLLLVAVVALGAARDGLAQRHAWRLDLEVEVPALLDAVQHGLEVHVRDAVHHELTRGVIALEREGGVLGRGALERRAELDLVRMVHQLDGARDHGSRDLARRG